MTRNPWSKGDIRLLCKMRRQEKSVRELCAYFGRHRASIYTVLQRECPLPQYRPMPATNPAPAEAALWPILKGSPPRDKADVCRIEIERRQRALGGAK